MISSGWSEKHYLRVFQLARDGLSEKEIAEALNVELKVFRRWRKEKPALAEAYRQGRVNSGQKKSRAKEIDGLHDKQRMFVHEFLVDMNATKAAERAGYSKNGAAQAGLKNLRRPLIQQAIHREMQERIQRIDIQADEVIRELGYIAFSDPKNLFDEQGILKQISEMSEPARRSISAFQVSPQGQVTLKFWDKNNALLQLMKHLGLIQNGSLPPVDKKKQELIEHNNNPYLNAPREKLIEAKRVLEELKGSVNGH